MSERGGWGSGGLTVRGGGTLEVRIVPLEGSSSGASLAGIPHRARARV